MTQDLEYKGRTLQAVRAGTAHAVLASRCRAVRADKTGALFQAQDRRWWGGGWCCSLARARSPYALPPICRRTTRPGQWTTRKLAMSRSWRALASR